MKDPIEIRLSGSGGQGLVLAGVILAEAAALDGMNVVQTQSYGPEARLGASRSEVILSKGKIAYPQVSRPDVLLCLSQDACDRYLPQVNSDTVVILDSTQVELKEPPKGPKIYQLPITKTAIDVGSKVVANVVALGVMNALLKLVSPESLREAVRRRVPARFRELNERALAAGEELAGSLVRAESRG
jgi:2-oxoglutarate ferredoxin oxidoreductase subunit gamma